MQTRSNLERIKLLVLFTLYIFFAVAFLSFDQHDPNWFNFITNSQVSNLEGKVGAVFASLGYYLFGGSIWVVFFIYPFVLFKIWQNINWRPKSGWAVFNIGVILIIIATSGLLTLYFPFKNNFLPEGIGGYIGTYTTLYSLMLFNDVGTTIIYVLVMTIGFIYLDPRLPKINSLPKIQIEKKNLTPKPKKQQDTQSYKAPDASMLKCTNKNNTKEIDNNLLSEIAQTLKNKLFEFGIEGDIVAIQPGPVVTRFELQPTAGTRASKVTSLATDIARSLSKTSVRIVEVIPGKTTIGIEIPNENREMVTLKDVVESKTFTTSKSVLTVALGYDIAGKPVVANLAKMPHLLVAGTTGSGKSVGLNTMLVSLLYKASPDELRLVLIDPKMLELSVYEGIPHLLTPVITDMHKAETALKWCVAEMERRYSLMAAVGVRNLEGYNEKVKLAKTPLPNPTKVEGDDQPEHLTPIPYIVVLADEYADMMMVVGKQVEQLIARIAQKARAAGIHLVLATQRPSVDVVTGLIKSNIPARISFLVSSKIDSRTILDQPGADQLLGHGDMLYLPPGTSLAMRVHGAYVDDEEVADVVKELSKTPPPTEHIKLDSWQESDSKNQLADSNCSDDLYSEAVSIVIDSKKTSISYIQRRLKIGYNRAASLIEAMETNGVVSSPNSKGQREILVDN